MIRYGLKILLSTSLFLCNLPSIKAQMAEWLTAVNHSYPISDLAVDGEGFVYILGNNFSSIYDSTLLDSIEISGKALSSPYVKGLKFFLSKVDPNGLPVWMKMIQPDYTFFLLDHPDGTNYLTIDNHDNVILNVEFSDTLTVENDTTIISISPYGTSPMAVYQNALIKYDKNGNFKMASVITKRLCSQGRVNGKIETDSLNNIYFRFGPDTNGSIITSAILKFDEYGQFVDSFYAENPADFTVNSQGHVYVGMDYGTTLFHEYDTSANFVQSFKTTVGNVKALIMTKDNLDNLILFCTSDDTVVVINSDTVNLDWYGGTFLLHLSPQMTVNWIKKLDYGSYSGDITINQYNEVIFTGLGLVQGAERFLDFKPKYPDSQGQSIVKLDANGNYLWSKFIEIYEGFLWPDIACDKNDNIYFTAYGHHPWPFHPWYFEHDSCFVDQLSAHGGKGFLLKLRDGTNQISGYVFEDKNNNGYPDSNDAYLPHQKIFIDSNYLMQSDSSGCFTMHVPKGNYSITIKDTFSLYNFNPLSHSATFSSTYGVDSNNNFKLVQDSTVGLKKDEYRINNILIYPNPSSGQINIDLTDNIEEVRLKIYNMQGMKVDEKKYRNTQRISSDLPPQSGCYIFEIRINQSAPKTFKVFRSF